MRAFRNPSKAKYPRFAMKQVMINAFVIISLFFALAKNAGAQVFSFTPSSGTHKAGDAFTVDLNIDTQNQEVASADVKLTYDSALLEVIKVDKGTFFSDEASYIGTGKLFVGGFFREPFAAKNGSGKLATLTLKGKSAGTARLTFVCSTEKNDSNILDTTSPPNDIIKCSGIQDSAYTITGALAGPTATPKPTSTPTPGGPTASPPVSGAVLPTFVFGLAGILLTILGMVIIF